MQNKNEKLLHEFTQYCRDNPSLRFWQALGNWSGETILVWKDKEDLHNFAVKDTFYFNNKNN